MWWAAKIRGGSRVRFDFHLSVEFGCLCFPASRVGMKATGNEFSWVEDCMAPAHQASSSRALAQSTPSRTQMGSFFLLSDAPGKASPAAKQVITFRPSFGKEQGEVCLLPCWCDWVTNSSGLEPHCIKNTPWCVTCPVVPLGDVHTDRSTEIEGQDQCSCTDLLYYVHSMLKASHVH